MSKSKSLTLLTFITLFSLLSLSQFSLAQDNQLKTIKGTAKNDQLVYKGKERVSMKGFQGQDTLKTRYAFSSFYSDGGGNDSIYLGRKYKKSNNLAQVINGEGHDTILAQKEKGLKYLDNLGNDRVVAANLDSQKNSLIQFSQGNNTFVGDKARLVDGQGNDTYHLRSSSVFDYFFSTLKLNGGENNIDMKGKQGLVVKGLKGANTFENDNTDSDLLWVGKNGGLKENHSVDNKGQTLIDLKGGTNFEIEAGNQGDRVELEDFGAAQIYTKGGGDVVYLNPNNSLSNNNVLDSGEGSDNIEIDRFAGVVELGGGRDNITITNNGELATLNALDGQLDQITCQTDSSTNLTVSADPKDDITGDCGQVIQ